MSLPAPPRQGRNALMSSPRMGPRMAQVTLIDLLDRLLQGGIVIQGEVMLAAADIDLVAVDLRLVIAAVDTLAGR
jgi:Gas vesicle protein